MPGPDGAEDYPDLSGYDAARREDLGRPPGFRMYGQTFVCDPVLRAGVLLDLQARTVRDGRLEALHGFLHDTLTDESWTRFVEMLNDRDRPVDVTGLDDAVAALLGQYTARPTPESSSSASTPSKRGKRSKAGSSSPEPQLRSA